MFGYGILLLALLSRALNAQQIVNGQIYTPGIAIFDAPQPNTPLGGGESFSIRFQSFTNNKKDLLQVALDVTSDGQLQLPPYPSNPTSAIFNITLFLSSYTTGKNFTISNGTATAGNASFGEIMQQEPSSTVKHVNWVWPDCLVGNGVPSSNDNTSRGDYNACYARLLMVLCDTDERQISIHQNFRLNGTNLYTIFNLPIHVTNEIPSESDRPSCDSLNNEMLSEAALNASANTFVRIPGTAIETSGKGTGIGGQSPDTSPSDGLGTGQTVDWRTGAHWIWLGSFAMMFGL